MVPNDPLLVHAIVNETRRSSADEQALYSLFAGRGRNPRGRWRRWRRRSG